MAKVPGLQRSGKGWIYRKRVPDKLRGINGLKREIKISLGRCSYDEAARKARLAAVEADATLAAAKRVLDTLPISAPSNTEIRQMVLA